MSFTEYVKNGLLDEAKCYLQENPTYDIHLYDECAFLWSCHYGQLEVAKWLASICEDYILEIKDNKIVSWKILTIFEQLSTLNKINKKHTSNEKCFICYENDVDRINFNCVKESLHVCCINCLNELK